MVLEILLWMLVLAMIALVVPSMIRGSRRSKAVKIHANLLMQDRDTLTPAQFATSYFPDNFDVAKSIHEFLANCLIVDCSRIRPEDSLFDDLGLGQVDGLAPNHFAVDVVVEFQVDLQPILNNNSPSVRDVINYVSVTTCNHRPAAG